MEIRSSYARGISRENGRKAYVHRRWVVRREGLEPSTCALRVRCSTIELAALGAGSEPLACLSFPSPFRTPSQCSTNY